MMGEQSGVWRVPRSLDDSNDDESLENSKKEQGRLDQKGKKAKCDGQMLTPSAEINHGPGRGTDGQKAKKWKMGKDRSDTTDRRRQ
jgi:hypothetical protein